MVASAPPIESVLPAFLEFARGAVLVAHNAPFDIGFLKAAAARCGHPWPGFAVVDTVHLARQVVTHDEVPNRKPGHAGAAVRRRRDPRPPGAARRAGHGRRAARAARAGRVARRPLARGA
ncbi:hypothetical protein GCM10025868_43390 [Angustibacter aerolatus]|uniref:Exonuclease domain-containing protein n=1 Tax=Angustibacter aerolatus TaxID=1162965 RepID=A0ABQ6JPL8_9ACTN|nr:exonuclease domain-containing protein [Angustibacter aerolatus]GMA89089.1 hypothetical protein GCM10025868_43390 [Angustibacter aerolatus]